MPRFTIETQAQADHMNAHWGNEQTWVVGFATSLHFRQDIIDTLLALPDASSVAGSPLNMRARSHIRARVRAAYPVPQELPLP